MTEIILGHFKERLTTQTSAPSEEHVHVQLEKILKSRSFARCPRLQRFLRYAVEITLRGDQRLKEYTLGIDVFDRDHTFDPRMDSIVRVEALRARKKLAGYYAGEGCQDEVLISLTKGNYRARVSRPFLLPLK